MPYPVSRLTPADAPRMPAVLDLFARAFEDPVAYTSAQPNRSYLERLLAMPSFIVLVASHHDTAVGALTAYVLPKPEQARSEVYLYDLAVDAAHRRQGVATALIARLREEAAQLGAYTIFVQADPEDDAAVALYTKLGTGQDVLHFDLLPGRR